MIYQPVPRITTFPVPKRSTQFYKLMKLKELTSNSAALKLRGGGGGWVDKEWLDCDILLKLNLCKWFSHENRISRTPTRNSALQHFCTTGKKKPLKVLSDSLTKRQEPVQACSSAAGRDLLSLHPQAWGSILPPGGNEFSSSSVGPRSGTQVQT